MTSAPSHPSSDTPLRSGDTLGRYQLGELLGESGTAKVWSAIRDDGTAVVVKQLLLGEGPEGEAFRKRFRQEAVLLRKLTAIHPRIVSVLDTIDTDEGLFLVTEHVDGITLEQVLAETGRPINALKALKLMNSAAHVLDAVHAADVIHRDIKPGNLMLAHQGGLKVLDLGVAALVAEQEALPVQSVRYMAPELFGGELIDGRADIYSLGMVAYEMLAGRAKFEEAFSVVLRDQRNRAVRWMKWHTNPRLTAPPLNQLNPEVTPRLSELVARMMEKDPARRVQSAKELIDAINRHWKKGSTPPPVTRPAPAAAAATPDTVEQTRRLPRKGLKWGVAALLIAMLSVGGLYYLKTQQDAEDLARKRQQAEVQLVLDRLEQADAVAGEDPVAAAMGYATVLAWADAPLPGELSPQVGDPRAGPLAGLRATGDDADAEPDAPPADDAEAALLPTERKPVPDRAKDAANVGFLMSLATIELEAARDEAKDLRRAQALYEAAILHLGLADTYEAADRDRIRRLRESADERVQFVKAVDQMRRLLATGRADARRSVENKLAEYHGQTLAADQLAQLQGLRVQIKGQLAHADAEGALARAQRLVAEGKTRQAIETLEAGLEIVASPKLQTLLDELREQGTYTAAVAEVDRREQRLPPPGRRDAREVEDLIVKYRELMQLPQARNDLDRYDQRIARLKSDLATLAGLQLMRDGKEKEAQAAFLEALGHADSPKATEMLEQMQAENDYEAVVAAADAALRKGEYASAIRQYDRALGMRPSRAIEDKKYEARRAMRLRAADDAVATGDLDAAKAAFERVLEIDRNNTRAIEGLQRIATQQRYRTLLAEGDAARERGLFGEARKYYEDAQRVINTPAVKDRLKDTQYDHWIAQAKGFMESGRWKAAEDALNVAGGIRRTDLVRQLLTEVKRNAPSVEEPDDA